MLARPEFQPFASRGRRTIVAILVTFAVFSTLSVALSIWTTKGSQDRATVVEVAARQRTLAERYVKEVLLARTEAQVDPANTASILARSADALLNGGHAPAVWGDDDETELTPAHGTVQRAQLWQEGRLRSHAPDILSLRLPPLASLERLTWRTVLVSLPLLTLGLVAGIVRSRQDRAGFDALEAVTLLTWAVYGAFIGLHPTGRRAAYLALGGFALVIVARLALAGSHFT